ncbi:hypothetical protein AAH991_33295 [Microbispora sp. ZYX-F-249]|uniref:Alkaline phosphatase-like protein PglZ C-terminal domain-containing protein n=1 Tax=Microbispora maris TaxID=3144104 RepID=A0ABV0B0H6_9ACTN
MPFTPHPLDRQRHTLALEADRLGEGGQGVVTRVLGPENLVYKEYMPQASQVNDRALADLVDFGQRQAAGEARTLLAQCAWPVARVVSGGRVTGFLMPEVPGEFYGPIGGKPKLVELQYLLYEPNWAWQDLHQPHVMGRLEIATLAAKLIDLLHNHGWIVGDLSFRNLLWRPAAPYKVFMLDCDGLRRHGAEPVLRQAHTPDWNDPHQPSSGPDLDTDRYKLALLVGRVLSRTASVRPGEEPALLPGLPDQVTTPVRELFARAAGPRGTRPAVAEWVQALEGRKRIAVTRPSRPQPSAPTGPLAPMNLGTGRSSVPISRPVPNSRRAPSQPVVNPTPIERRWAPLSHKGGVPAGQAGQAARTAAPTQPGFQAATKVARLRPVSVTAPASGSPAAAPPTTPATPATGRPTLGQRVINSRTYAEQRLLAPRGGVVDDGAVARVIDHLAAGTGRDAVVNIARLLGETSDRTVLLMRASKNLLNVEQADVIALKDGDRTVELNVSLLEEQFLEEDEP